MGAKLPRKRLSWTSYFDEKEYRARARISGGVSHELLAVAFDDDNQPIFILATNSWEYCSGVDCYDESYDVKYITFRKHGEKDRKFYNLEELERGLWELAVKTKLWKLRKDAKSYNCESWSDWGASQTLCFATFPDDFEETTVKEVLAKAAEHLGKRTSC